MRTMLCVLTVLAACAATGVPAHAAEESSPDPRPCILLLGGKNARAWDSGLGWADSLVQERLIYDVEVESPENWHLWDFRDNIESVLEAHPDALTIVIATGTMEAGKIAIAKHDPEALWKIMKDLIARIRAARPEAVPVIVTPLPVVQSRLKDDGRHLFGSTGESTCLTIKEAFAYAGQEMEVPVIDLYAYAWKMNRHPFQPNARPGAPGFVLGSRGYELRDWGPPMIVPWIAEQIDALKPAAADPEAYAAWLDEWRAQLEADKGVQGLVSHGAPFAPSARTSAVVPPEAIEGPTLDVLVKVKQGTAKIQPCISNKHPDLAALTPMLQVKTDQGAVLIPVQPGHWQILDEAEPDKAREVYDFADTIKFKQRYYARLREAPDKRMWVLLRFLLGDLEGREVLSAELKIHPRGGNPELTIHPILGSDRHWHPVKATWKTRDGNIPWNGGPDGAPVQTVAQAEPRPSHGACRRVELGGAVKEEPIQAIARDVAIARDLAHIEELAKDRGGWEDWARQLKTFRNEVRAKVTGTEWPWPAKQDYVFQGLSVDLMLMDKVDTDPEGGGALDLLLSLHNQLKSMGIDLILLPIPDKIAVYPDYMADRAPEDLQVNVAALRLIHDLLKRDVEVIDLYSLFSDFRKNGADKVPLYYAHDSHWLNRAARMAARAVAERLHRYEFVQAAVASGSRYATKPIIRQDGDADHVTQIWDTRGGLYRSDRKSPVLLTGDSFSEMNKHLSGSLDAQIASYIGLPITHVSRAGFGPNNAILYFARDKRLLQERRVVVISFITRFLARSDKWQIAEFTSGPERRPVAKVHQLPAAGVVEAVSEGPPQRSEYKDFFMQILLKDLKDKDGKLLGDGRGVAHVLAMKDKKHLPIAGVKPGDKLELSLTSWAEVPAFYASIESGTLDDLAALLELPFYYGAIPGRKEQPGKRAH